MADLSKLLTPHSIALIGASATPGANGNDAMHNLLHHSRIPGPVHLVNPGRDEIEGHPCLRSIEQLPAGEVDTAFVIVGADSVVDTVRRCALRGVRFAVVPTGGLGELGGDGLAEQDRLREVARYHGIRVYGPNCPGLTNVNDRMLLSVSPSAASDTRGGPIGLITQGGALGRNVLQYMDRGVGIGCWLSPGNEVDLELADFVEHLTTDPRIRVIACIIEGFRDGRRFLRAAAMAAAAGKPVVVMLLGGSQTGAAAARSHTAHLAVPSRVARSVLRQHGVMVVDEIDQLVELAAFLARGPLPEAPAPCVISFSGGAVVAAVDALDRAGVALRPLSGQTTRRLAEALPGFGTAANPLDLTMDVMRRPEIATEAVAAIRDDPAVNTLVVPIPGDYGPITARFVHEVLAYETAAESSTPGRRMVPVWSSPRRGDGCTELEARGILPFTTFGSMATALAAAAAYRDWLARDSEDCCGPQRQAAPARVSHPRRTGPWTEARTKKLLHAAGITVPASAFAAAREDVAAQVERLGFPAALKIQSKRLPHKTDVHGVALDIRTVDDALAGWDRAIAGAETEAGVPADLIDGVLLERMVPDGIDLIVAVRRDRSFGHLAAIGVGGIFTEVLADTVFVTAAPQPATLEGMLRGLAAWPVLAGARGRSPLDVAALADLLATLDRLLAEDPHLVEIEINPLRSVSSTGELVALDALVEETRETAE